MERCYLFPQPPLESFFKFMLARSKSGDTFAAPFAGRFLRKAITVRKEDSSGAGSSNIFFDLMLQVS